MRGLKAWRDKIDEIDTGILRLLSRRAEVAIELGRLKRSLGLPYHVPQRERHVLARLMQVNRGSLHDRSIEKLFRLIMRERRRVQENGDRSAKLNPRRK